MEDQAKIYETRIFDARERFIPGAPASRYQVGWQEALNYVLVGELPDNPIELTLGPADRFRTIVKTLEALEEHYATQCEWTNAGRMKGLRINVQKLADSMGIDTDG